NLEESIPKREQKAAPDKQVHYNSSNPDRAAPNGRIGPREVRGPGACLSMMQWFVELAKNRSIFVLLHEFYSFCRRDFLGYFFDQNRNLLQVDGTGILPIIGISAKPVFIDGRKTRNI